MSFLPSYITSTLQGLPPLPAQLLTAAPVGDSKLVVKVTPLRRSSFAGELFQAQISFALENPRACSSGNAKESTNDEGQAGAQAAAGNLLRRPSAPATPTGRGSPGHGKPVFKPAHRSAQSLSNPFIPSLHPPPGQVSSQARSVSASHAQRSAATKLPAGHPHARKPSFAPLPNGPDGFSTVDVPTMSALRRTSAGSVTSAAPPKSPMPLSSILEGDAQRATSEDETADEVTVDGDVFSAPSGGSIPRSDDGSSPARSFGPPTRPNGHRYRSSLSIGHGPPPSPSPAPIAAPAPPSPVPSGSGLTITWSHVQLQATLSPSPQHLPPEALLPLRQALLDSSTLGSGSLLSSSRSSGDPSASSSAGGWFSLPPPPRHARAPSLTSSLFGMAKTMWSGAGVENTGSLEEDRRRMWERTVKEIPVFDTLRSVCGVGIELKEASAERDPAHPLNFTYSVPLPAGLPPTFKGKVLKISYALVITVEIEYPLPPLRPGYDSESGPRKRRTKAVTLRVPINVWGSLEEPTTKAGYDMMRPTIQRTQTAKLEQSAPPTKAVAACDSTTGTSRENVQLLSSAPPATRASFLSYAAHLFSTLPPREPPPLPADASSASRPERHQHTRSQALSPSTFTQSLPEVHVNGRSSATAAVEDEAQRAKRMDRLADLDQTVERDSEDVIDDLVRASKKASYDIEKEGEVVAVLTLVKSAYRLGETVSGVVTFNAPSCTRRVLKFSAYLQTHEVVPASLHAPTGPKLKPFVRTHAAHHSALTPQTTRMPFSLDLAAPGSAALGGALSPSFHLRAGESVADSKPGGLHWKVHVAFLVSAPSRSQPTSVEVVGEAAPTHLIAADPADATADATHELLRPTSSIAPVVALTVRDPARPGAEGVLWQEMRTEVVECDVDLAMFAPSRLGLAALNVSAGEPGSATADDGAVSFVI